MVILEECGPGGSIGTVRFLRLVPPMAGKVDTGGVEECILPRHRPGSRQNEKVARRFCECPGAQLEENKKKFNGTI